MGKSVDLRRLIGDLREADGNVTFVIGAGASISAGIPLASKLVEEICTRYGHLLDGLTESERANYGRVMGRLLPGQREKLITPYLEGAKLNWGHIALASMIAERRVKRVLTFNFDLILERALALLGRHVAVYDFGMMPTKEINRLVEPSIIHLHGQGYGMKLLNSEDETRAHCENLRPLFGTALKESLTVVFGYGGRSDPVLELMTAENSLRYPLYWLGHDETASEHLTPLLATEDATYLGGCDFDRVMTRVAEGLDAWPPSILANPMRHVREALAPTTDYPVGDDAAVDILQEARRRLAVYEVDWDTNRTPEQRALESSMGSSEGASQIESGDLASLSQSARLALAWRLVAAGTEMALAARTEEGELERDKLSSAIGKFAEALSVQPDIPEALNNWGAALLDMSKHLSQEAALTALREAEEKCAQAVAVKPYMHEALTNWGNVLVCISRYLQPAAKLEALQEAGNKFAQAVAVKHDNHEALSNWGGALVGQSKHLPAEAALAALREAVEKYAQAVAMKPDDHEALSNWGVALTEMSKHLPAEAALAALQEAVEKYAQAVAVKPDKYEALNNWGSALCIQAALSTGDDRARFLDKAEEVLARLHDLTGKTSYNLACVHALRGDAVKAVAALVACRADGLLPGPAHLDADTDLDSIRDDPAYRAFRAGLEPPPTPA